ncbi:MAG: NADH-dependent alcohol dehydrogenase, partial [Crocinitomicaceae bacterium]
RVWGITDGTIEEKAKIGIDKTVGFFHSIGIDTKLSDYTKEYAGTGAEVARRLTDRNMIALGEHGKLTPQDAEKIVEMAY